MQLYFICIVLHRRVDVDNSCYLYVARAKTYFEESIYVIDNNGADEISWLVAWSRMNDSLTELSVTSYSGHGKIYYSDLGLPVFQCL